MAAIAANDVWVAGYYFPGSYAQTLIEHWDGTSWSVVPSPNGCCTLRGVAAVAANDVWAVGNQGGPFTLVEIHAVLQSCNCCW